MLIYESKKGVRHEINTFWQSINSNSSEDELDVDRTSIDVTEIGEQYVNIFVCLKRSEHGDF